MKPVVRLVNKARRVARAQILVGFICAIIVTGAYYATSRVPYFSRQANQSQHSTHSHQLPSTASSQRRQLLLITYGRTGSTFTAAIISHDPKVFYTSEPLHAMPPDIYDPNITATTKQKAFDTIDALLSCDFRNLDPGILRDQQFRVSSSTNSIYECLRNKKLGGYAHVSCFLSMWDTCLKKPVSFIKTIRFRSEWAERYLKKFPNLQILFLVRDVRAVLYSHSRTFKTFQIDVNVTEKSTNLCQQMKGDYHTFLKLKSIYPDRIKGMRYEDGCLDPEKYARTIFTFSFLSFNKNVLEFVNSMTKSNRTNVRHSYSIERGDSVKAMNRWRQSANIDTVKYIDNVCSDVYELYGYKRVSSVEELRSTEMLIMKLETSKLFSD